MFKALVTGKLSLAKTFWGWGFGGTALIVAISKAGAYAGHYSVIPVSHALQALLSLAVLSGLTFILKEKHSFLGVLLGGIAFAIFLAHFILSAIFAVRFSSVIFF
ncbi:UNVERIFIED_ORG: hypothetical protein FHW05_004529 [Pantoea agglomerans]